MIEATRSVCRRYRPERVSQSRRERSSYSRYISAFMWTVAGRNGWATAAGMSSVRGEYIVFQGYIVSVVRAKIEVGTEARDSDIHLGDLRLIASPTGSPLTMHECYYCPTIIRASIFRFEIFRYEANMFFQTRIGNIRFVYGNIWRMRKMFRDISIQFSPSGRSIPRSTGKDYLSII